jgi:hypothetical protein
MVEREATQDKSKNCVVSCLINRVFQNQYPGPGTYPVPGFLIFRARLVSGSGFGLNLHPYIHACEIHVG